MQTVDKKPETIHLYVVREEEPNPPLFPVLLSVLTLSLLLAYCILAPYRQPVQEVVIRVSAVFPPLQTFSTTIPIIPTGIKTYPATTAHGILTITNGSIISQTLPKGMIIGAVSLDYPVFVPAGSANGYGVTTVSAHALISGKSGNIPAFGIDSVENASVYIRNLTSFHGGKDSYTIPLQLPKDRQTAIDHARTILAQLAQYKAILAYPCKESNHIGGVNKMIVDWSCQFFTYSVSPIVHVTHVRLSGKTVIVDGFIVVRPRPFTGK
jgi:hypothetical protein